MQPEQQEVNIAVENNHVDGGKQSGEEMSQVAVGNSGEMPKATNQDYNWKQANEALSSMKADKHEMAKQLHSLTSLVTQLQEQNKGQQQSYFHDREKADIPNIEDVEGYVKNIVGAKEKEFDEKTRAFNEKTREFQLKLDEMNVKAVNPDFKETIERFQPYLSDSQKKVIINSETPWSDAYNAVVNSAAYYKDQISKQQSPGAKRISDNSQKIGSLSSVGNSASLSRSTSWENYSDEELIRMSDNFANGGG